MAEVKSFSGVRYNPQKAASTMADLVCPPYDVISPEAQQAFLAKTPYNIIRLELGEKFENDDDSNNRYTRSASTLKEWLESGILFKEQRPAYYLYEQEFESYGQSYKRRALLAAVRLHDWAENVILPHEHTLNHPKADRLALLQATNTNLSPIFCIYPDSDGNIANQITPRPETQLLCEFKDAADETTRLWLIDEPTQVEAIEEAFATKQLYIADGHHRYETALAYRNEQRATGGAEGGPADYVMMALTAIEDPGLVVLPYHRLVKGLSEEALETLNETLPHYFGMEEAIIQGEEKPGEYMVELIHNMDSEGSIDNHVFGVYGMQPNIMSILKLKSHESVSELMPPHSEAWQNLDVSIFQTVVLEGCLGMTEESVANEEKLSYTRDIEQAVTQVDAGEVQLLFVMPPTMVENMVAVADAHDQMPPKSTYFYPKFQTGLVMRPLD
jgi:uncharacterized protein (DUF1015 family)